MSTDNTTDASTETESKCGASEAGSASESASEVETDTTSKCGASASSSTETSPDTGDDTASKCGASSSSESSSSSSSRSCGASSSSGSSDEEEVGATVDDFDAEPGRLIAVGLGPGQPEGMTARARSALMDAEHIVGYTTYVELLPDEITEGADDIYNTPMCGEVSRTEEAIDRALAGNDVAIIGSGDPNVYALAGLALEIIESKGATATMLDFDVVPGVPAVSVLCRPRRRAAGQRHRLHLAVGPPHRHADHRVAAPRRRQGGFTITIYNPWSRKRRDNYEKCCEILLEHRDPETPVGVVHAAGREDEQVEIVELGELPELGETDLVDMTTTLLVGNEDTYVWDDRMVTRGATRPSTTTNVPNHYRP